MKYFLSLILSFFTAYSFAQIDVSGEITTATWSYENSPYHVVDEVTVTGTLTIEPGVEIIFDGAFGLNVEGMINAEGTQTDSIYFYSPPTADVKGIGIYLNNSDNLNTFSYCSVHHMESIDDVHGFSYENSDGGGGFYIRQSRVTIEHCTIRDNIAGVGAGILGFLPTSLEVYNTVIKNNSAVNNGFNGSGGGGIYLIHGDATISNCHIYGNSYTGNVGNFEGGGGVHLNGGTINFINNTVFGNSALNGTGIMIKYNTAAILANNIIWGNTGSIKDEQITLHRGTTDCSTNNFAGVDISYNLIEDLAIIYTYRNNYCSDFSGNGTNSPNDPLLINPEEGNFEIALGSAAADAGSNSYVNTETDILGNERFFDLESVEDVGFGTAPIVDIGAIEMTKLQGPQNISFVVNDKTYGEGQFSLSATSNTVNVINFESSENDVITIVGTTATITGAGEVTIIASQEETASYFAGLTEQTITVFKAALTVSAENTTITYGESPEDLVVSYEGFQYEDTKDDLDTESDAVAEYEGVGEYDISVSGGTSDNYDFSYEDGTLTVEKATLTVSADEQEITYGDEEPAYTYSYDGFVFGDDDLDIDTEPTDVTPGEAVSNAGSYTLSVSEDGEDDNYDFAYEDGLLLVNKAVLTATIEDEFKTYGAPIADLVIDYDGFVNGEDESVLADIIITEGVSLETEVGEYDSDFVLSESDNYTVSTTPATITISPAELAVSAIGQTISYGQSPAEYVLIYDGFVNGETEEVLESEPDAIAEYEGVGEFNITVSGGTSDNYDFSYEGGTLTVEKASLTITANDVDITFGDEIPELSYEIDGFVPGEGEEDITPPSIGTEATASSNAGTYDITLDEAAADNYEITLDNGVLSIAKAKLTVVPESSEMIYGDNLPIFSQEITGYIGVDGLGDIDTAPTLSTEASSVSDVGNYEIESSGGLDINYYFDYALGALTINQASLIATADDQSKTYGEVNPTFTASYEGFKNDDIESDLDTAPSAVSAADVMSDVGTYDISLSGGLDNNYSITEIVGTLTIDPATLKISADNQAIKTGEPIPDLTVTYEGFVNDDTESDITAPTISTEATSDSAVGSYDITLEGGEASNYSLTLVNGVLTIEDISEVLGLNHNDKTKLTTYPNPTVNSFQLSDQSGILRILIFTSNGSLVKEFNGQQNTFNVQNLKPGLYTVILEKGDQIITKKLIKE